MPTSKERVGKVSVECAGKKGFRDFGFFRQGDNCALRGEDGFGRIDATHNIKGGRMGVC